MPLPPVPVFYKELDVKLPIVMLPAGSKPATSTLIPPMLSCAFGSFHRRLTSQTRGQGSTWQNAMKPWPTGGRGRPGNALRLRLMPRGKDSCKCSMIRARNIYVGSLRPPRMRVEHSYSPSSTAELAACSPVKPSDYQTILCRGLWGFTKRWQHTTVLGQRTQCPCDYRCGTAWRPERNSLAIRFRSGRIDRSWDPRQVGP